MWDIVIVGASALASGIGIGLIANAGRSTGAVFDTAKLNSLEVDRELHLNRIERLRGDNFALAAKVDELTPLADMGRRVRDARDKQNAKKKATRAAAKS
jgi:hypothetical protein